MCNFIRTIRKHNLLEWVFLVWYDIANCKHRLSNGFHESNIYVAQTIYAIDAIKRDGRKKIKRLLNGAIHCILCGHTIEWFFKEKVPDNRYIFLLFACLNCFKWMMNAFLGNGLIKNQNSPETHKSEFCVQFYTIWMRFRSHSENRGQTMQINFFRFHFLFKFNILVNIRTRTTELASIETFFFDEFATGNWVDNNNKWAPVLVWIFFDSEISWYCMTRLILILKTKRNKSPKY